MSIIDHRPVVRLVFKSNPAYYENVSDENQDPNDDSDPINVLSETKDTVIDDEIAIEDIDLLLQDEDPDFLKQISEIRVDTAGINLSIMDDVIYSISAGENKNNSLRSHLRNLFFFNENPKRLILFWALILTGALIVFFSFHFSELFLTKGLFLRSYAEWGLVTQSYNPIGDVEPFYDNPRFAKNLMTMTKMFANVKPSENSGTNPMLALEINVEGMSAESIIEIKDREAEFKDILLRESEDFSYDELTSVEGKKSLLEKYQSALNANLTEGKVRRVLLKSFILKP